MDTSTELNKRIVISVLDELRTSPKSKREIRLFEEVAEDAWKELKLEGSPNPILLENMLIDSIKGLYNNADSESVNDDIRRERARKFDVSLLMFGLLDGYYHTKLESGQKTCVPLKIRYDQYLGTDIFTDLEYPGKGSYEDIKAADKKADRKQPRPLNLIMSIAKECKTEIATSLLKSIRSGAYKNCSQDARFDEKTGQRTDLPKPRFTLDNFKPKGQPIKPPLDPNPHPKSFFIQILRDNWLEIIKIFLQLVSTISLIIIAVALVIIVTAKDDPPSSSPPISDPSSTPSQGSVVGNVPDDLLEKDSIDNRS